MYGSLLIKKVFTHKCGLTDDCSGGSKGSAPAPTDQNFLNFMQFLGKSG